MNSKWMQAALAILLVLIALVYWPWKRGAEFPIPPSMSAEDIAACPDGQLVATVTRDLRYRLVAGPGGMERWRTLAEPARHVLSLSWVINDNPLDAPITPAFTGFASIVGNPAPNAASPEDIALACEAIGAAKLAGAAREAMEIAASDAAKAAVETGGPAAHQPFAAVDGRFREQVPREEPMKLLRAYIRVHGDAIAAAHL